MSRKSTIADSYLSLILDHPLVSIRSKGQFEAAQRVIDRLLTKGKLNRGEETYLVALSDFLAAYEDIHIPIPPASDADMLRHLMEANGVSQAELSRQSGIARSTISEVLSGKKAFSKSMIRTFTQCFDVHVSVLASNL